MIAQWFGSPVQVDTSYDGVAHSVAFCACLLSPGVPWARPVHGAVCVSAVLLFMAKEYFIIWTDHICLNTHLFVDIQATVKNAAVNVHVCVSAPVPVLIALGLFPGVEPLGHMVTLFTVSREG